MSPFQEASSVILYAFSLSNSSYMLCPSHLINFTALVNISLNLFNSFKTCTPVVSLTSGLWRYQWQDTCWSSSISTVWVYVYICILPSRQNSCMKVGSFRLVYGRSHVWLSAGTPAILRFLLSSLVLSDICRWYLQIRSRPLPSVLFKILCRHRVDINAIQSWVTDNAVKWW